MDASSYLGYQGLTVEPIADASALGCGASVDDRAVFATGRTSTAIEATALDATARTRFESGTVIDLALVPEALSASRNHRLSRADARLVPRAPPRQLD